MSKNIRVGLIVLFVLSLYGCATTPFQAPAKQTRIGIISNFSQQMKVHSSSLFFSKSQNVPSKLNTWSADYSLAVLKALKYQPIIIHGKVPSGSVVPAFSLGQQQFTPAWRQYLEDKTKQNHVSTLLVITSSNQSGVCQQKNQIKIFYTIYLIKTNPLRVISQRGNTAYAPADCSRKTLAAYTQALNQAIPRINNMVSNDIIAVMQGV